MQNKKKTKWIKKEHTGKVGLRKSHKFSKNGKSRPN
jgi:hypothetical protein